MNLTQPIISAIESGQRKVTAEELGRFSILYGVSTAELMKGKVNNDSETTMFIRAFSELSDIDKKEIMNLIDFKKRYMESLITSSKERAEEDNLQSMEPDYDDKW